ncbi:MAG: Histidine-tRNA ligase [Candidatus Magasanikbacteria bacterium GW2011_GWA2_56_11]|uniref:Histidine--tRNA ligase n=1 Tax=Candidatus Magasanikbacteria bacterium GW2011_GWA2_56_11 TaxID=1619044 RepID=A0A0G2ALT0_9BACT|nr:MAG: Histidine-tRNA ligase [Candidatus Magasanikbacteria bacterium GW2011_GWA2_56_11]
MSPKKHTMKYKKPAVESRPKPAPAEEEKSKKTAAGLALVRGMKDILPPESALWREAHQVFERVAGAYGFEYIETPIVEAASLFIRSLGRSTDVVEKEMYLFEDRDGGKLCLRPELTASVVRAYIMHGLQTLPQPVKVWSAGAVFRYDRPQAGRYREFHQLGCENLGEKSPVVDAELIALAYNFLRDLGIPVVVHINSLGTPADREQYLVELVGYWKSKRTYLCEDCKRRLTKNPLRILDCKNDSCQPVIAEAPQIIDWLSDDSKGFFMRVLEYLDELSIPYVLTATLVRGLDYYTHTVFELYEETAEEKSQNALGGGGRYDLLAEHLGGQPTPASGFGLGVERIMSVWEKRRAATTPAAVPGAVNVFFAQLGEQAKRRSLYLIEELRREGISVHHNLAKSSLKVQLEAANKLGATHTIILGQKEVQDGTILVRNMDSGIQEIVDQKKLKQTLRRLLGVS